MSRSQFVFAGPEGTAATTGNTGASTIQLTSGATAVSAAAVQGTASGFGIKVTTPPAATGIAYLRFLHPTASQAMGFNLPLQRPTTNPSTSTNIARTRSTSGPALTLSYNTVGSLVMNDATGTNWTLATAAQLDSAGVTAGAMFRWKVRAVSGASTTSGQFSAKLSTLTGTAFGSVQESSTANLTTALLAGVDMGLTNAATPANYSTGFADIAMEDSPGTTLPSEVADATATSAAPTVNAGQDFTVDPNLETGATITLSGLVTPGTGDTIASVKWEQITGGTTLLSNGNPVTINTPTTTQGSTVTYRLTGTGTTGGTTTDDVVVTVKPHNLWTGPGGSIPLRLR